MGVRVHEKCVSVYVCLRVCVFISMCAYRAGPSLHAGVSILREKLIKECIVKVTSGRGRGTPSLEEGHVEIDNLRKYLRK